MVAYIPRESQKKSKFSYNLRPLATCFEFQAKIQKIIRLFISYFEEVIRMFREVLSVFHGRLSSVSKEFQGCFKEELRVIQENFKVVIKGIFQGTKVSRNFK